jgi:hypothetical protein
MGERMFVTMATVFGIVVPLGLLALAVFVIR